MKNKNINGLWFYGLSGVGKSYISNLIKKKIKNSILIDGDDVRSNISFDLGYNLFDRKIQIRRLLGLSKIIINQNYFPVVSSVYMNNNILNLCKKIKLKVIKIEIEDFDKIRIQHKTYKNKKDVIGVNLELPKLTTPIFINNKKYKKWQILSFLKKLI